MIQEAWLYGYHPIREALRRRPHEVSEVWIAGRIEGGRRQEIEALCQRHRIPLESVSEAVLRQRLGERHHNGFGARIRADAEPSNLEIEAAAAVDEQLFVLLEDIQDPRNLGAILRVCEGAGVGRVLIRDRGTAPITPVVSKTSVGATQWLNIERITNPARSIRALKDDGFWVYGADMTGDEIWDVDLTGPLVLCLGGEAKGLRPNTRKHCDRLVSLPMRGRIESLNVASATAALLYEAVRQRLIQERA